MAKSLRSKIMRRWRDLKRSHLKTIIEKPRLDKITHNLKSSLLGLYYREVEPKNAFLFPNDPASAFPQYTPPPIIDLRSSAIPESGLQWSGAGKKAREKIEESEAIEVEQPAVHLVRADLPVKKKRSKSKLRKSLVF